MPNWITSNEVLEYFFYAKSHEDCNFTFSIPNRKLLQIADFFNNEELVAKIVKYEIIPSITFENGLLFLEDSYEKLTKGEAGEIIDNCWFDLFYGSIDYISKSFLNYLNHESEKLKLFNKKVLGEIIDK